MSTAISQTTKDSLTVQPDQENIEGFTDDKLDPLDWMLLMMGENPSKMNTHVAESRAPLSEQMTAQLSKEEDMYGWLKVPTKHSHLRRLLRVKLVELFSERGMNAKFEDLVDEFEASVRKNTGTTSTSVASNKVAEDFFGLPLPPEEAEDAGINYKLSKTVRKLGTGKEKLELAIMVAPKLPG